MILANKEYEMAVRIAGEIERSFYNSTNLSKKELKSIAKTASQASTSVSSSFRKGMQETSGVFDDIEKAGKKSFKAIATASAVAGTAVVAGLSATTAVGASFEKQMSSVQSICNASSTELAALKEKAEEMGATTAFSATEAGEAMEYMAMAGWKTTQMINGIDGIMNLAAASGEELGTTSDIVTDALTAFGLKAEDSTHFADILAAASSNANTNVSMMGETFKYAAPIAGALGYTAEDTALAIGLMANSGIKASQAGTNLRKIMSNTSRGITLTGKAFAKAGEQVGEYKIATSNADGSMRELKDILDELREGYSKLTESEQATNADKIAGKTAMSGLLAMVNATDSDYQKLYESIENCNGATERMAETRLANLNGDITILKSGLEGLGIQIYEDLNYPMRYAAQTATSVVSEIATSLKNGGQLGDFIDSFESELPTVIREAKQFKEAMIDLGEPLINIGQWLLDHPDVIVSTIAGIGTTLAVYKVANNIMKLAQAFTALSPAGLAILGLAGVVAVISGIATHTALANREMKKQNLAEHFGDISLSLEDLKEVADSIIRTDSLGKIEESIKAIDDMGEISNTIDDALEDINRMNWKVSIGMELSESDKQSYQDNITSYISNVQELVKQKQYAVNLSVGALLTDDGVEESNVIEKINAFYSDKESELQQLGTKLNETVTDAFKDGLLDMDEAKEITELQQQMADIQSAVASSKFDAQLELLDVKYSGGELDAESFQNLQDEINTQLEAAKSNYDESLTLSISNAKVMLDDGAISQEEYDSTVEELKKGYLENIGELELRATNFETNTIKQQYANEIAELEPELQATVYNALNEVVDGINSGGFGTDKISWGKVLSQVQNTEGIDESTKAAMADLYNLLQPNVEKLVELQNKYKEYGMKIPESIGEGISDATILGTIAGDTDSIWSYVGQSVATSSELSSALERAANTGKYIPEQVGAGIIANKTAVDGSIESFHQYVQGKINTSFSSGFNVSVPVNVSTKQIGTLNPSDNIYNSLPGHADGGIFTKPHIAWFAEAGDAEAAIPINNSKRSASLWQETGELLGLYNSSPPTDFSALSYDVGRTSSTVNNNNQSENQTIQVQYSPQYTIQGSASKEDILKADEIAQEKFNRMMETWRKENIRTNFGN